jgi:tellurite methyltransferase
VTPGGALTDPRGRWNERHRARLDSEGAPEGPAEWLAMHAGLLENVNPGRALDVACGTGRNAVFLARRGFDVDAVDVSDVAVEHVWRTARQQGLSIEAVQMDLRRDLALPRPPYDVIVCTYFLERPLFAAMAAMVASGGLLFVETFTSAQANEAYGPSEPQLLLRPGELAGAFAGLELVKQREATLTDGWVRHVAGIVARKP